MHHLATHPATLGFYLVLQPYDVAAQVDIHVDTHVATCSTTRVGKHMATFVSTHVITEAVTHVTKHAAIPARDQTHSYTRT